MNKRVMILGSLEEFVQLVQMAKDRGIYTVVCDGNINGPAKRVADKAYHIDVCEINTIAEICKLERVDGILTAFSDLLLECMVKISKVANLPCYLTPEQAVFYRDKSQMKKMFQSLGIATPKFSRLRVDFKDEDLKDFCFPLVVKPIDKYGSRGVGVMDSIQQIRNSFEVSCETSKIKEILAEEYNGGYEFNMMAWVHGSQVYVLSIADREKNEVGIGKIPINTRNVYPSCLIKQVYEEAKEIMEKIISFTGQKEGQISMQFFWSPEQKVEVCEVAARFLGYEHELIEYCSGLSVEEIILDNLYDMDRLQVKLKEHNPFFTKCAAVLYFQGREDKIFNMNSARNCFQNSYVKKRWLFYEEGEYIREFAKPYVARCYIQGDNRAEIDKITDIIYDSMSILNEEGKELLYHNKRVSY